MTFNIEAHVGSMGYSQWQSYGIANFRYLSLTVFLQEFGLDETSIHRYGVQAFFDYMVEILANRAGEGVVNLKICFKVRERGLWSIQRGRIPYDVFNPKIQPRLLSSNLRISEYSRRVAWFRAQVRHRVSCLRAALLEYAPYVNLETNIESGGFQVQVKRLSSTQVMVKIPDFRQTLQMKISGSTDIEMETVSEWDDSDLENF